MKIEILDDRDRKFKLKDLRILEVFRFSPVKFYGGKIYMVVNELDKILDLKTGVLCSQSDRNVEVEIFGKLTITEENEQSRSF